MGGSSGTCCVYDSRADRSRDWDARWTLLSPSGTEDRTVNVRIRTSRNVLPALWIADRWAHENQIVRLRWRQCRSLGLAMISLSLYSTQVDGLCLKTCGSLPQRVSAGHLPGLALACYHCLLFSFEDGYLIA